MQAETDEYIQSVLNGYSFDVPDGFSFQFPEPLPVANVNRVPVGPSVHLSHEPNPDVMATLECAMRLLQ
jgi:hypothetical protein